MPCLSVIIPHDGNDQALEATLLSVLENRSPDVEVIITHDGSYRDPYDLGDEVLFVEVQSDADSVERVNSGVLAAGAPTINTLFAGAIVSPGWFEASLDILNSEEDVAAVSCRIHHLAPNKPEQISFGFSESLTQDLNRLRKGAILEPEDPELSFAPEMTCGFFRKSVLLALDGFLGANPVMAAIEFGWALQHLGYLCLADEESSVDNSTACPTPEASDLAQIALHFGLVQSGSLSAIRELVPALIALGHRAVPWCSQIWTGQALSPPGRLAQARQRLENRRQEAIASDGIRRRAA